MPVDYARFAHLGDSESDAEGAAGEEDDWVGRARSEESLLRAFVEIHEGRLALDKRAADAKTSGGAAGLAQSYEDVCARLLALDGVRHESSLNALGHRVEMVAARLGAARAHMVAGTDAAAERSLDRALAAAQVGRDAAGERWREQSTGSPFLPPAVEAQGADLLFADVSEVFLLRAEVRVRRHDFRAARSDALEACSSARRRGDGARAAAAEALAVKCEVALHGGGPGPDGRGTAMSPEELSGFQVSAMGAQTVQAGPAESDSEDEGQELRGQPPAPSTGSGSAGAGGLGSDTAGSVGKGLDSMD